VAGEGASLKTNATGADKRPVLAGSAGFWFCVKYHQIAKSTTTTIRMIAQSGKPLEVGAGGVGTLDAADWAVRAAELAAELTVELAAVAAFETVDEAV